jgi:pyruvate-formate lyase-activating enzyme
MMKKYDNILLSTKKYKVQRDYWVNYLYDLEVQQMIKTRFDGNGRLSSTVRQEEIRYSLPPGVTGKLIKLSRDSDVTLYVVLLSAFMVFLSRYTGRADVYLGSPVYKEDPDENLLNDFVVLRIVINEDMSFKDVLVSMKDKFIKACENRDYPFDKIIEELNHIAGNSYDLLFHLVFASENIHDIETTGCPKNNDLLVSFIREESNIAFTFRFNGSLYNKGEIKGNAGYFNRIISCGVDNPLIKISQMDMLSEEEKQQILTDFNSTGVKYPKDKTITRLFLDQVDNAPGTVAAVYEDKHLTYGELNRRAAHLAGLLRGRGVGPDRIVGIMVERSLEMVIGILGIIKAGGAYLPIDANAPKNRIITMLADSRSPLLLTTVSAAAGYPFTVMQGLRYGGAVPHVNPRRSQVKNLDALPIVDRSLVDYEKYHRCIGLTMVKNSITMMATRGCPFDCTYCHKIWPKQHVVRSAENIFAEIRIYYHMGIRRFAFIDDIFNLDRKNTERLLQMIVKNNMDLRLLFPAGFRGDILAHDYIDLMVEAGTVNISMSLETASRRLQKLVKKNLDIEKLRENLHYIIKKYPGIILELFTMHGFPTETEKEAMETLQFIKDLEWLHFPYIHVLKIYPGTDMEKLALKSGISADAIYRSMELAWHEIPETLPFDRSFTLRYQGEFLDDYFLNNR